MRFRKDGIDPIARVRSAREIFAALPGIWTRKRTEDSRSPKNGLKARALPSRCHLNDVAVFINRHDRDHTAIGKKHVVERAIGVQQDLTLLAGNRFKCRQKSFGIARWQGEKEPIAGPI